MWRNYLTVAVRALAANRLYAFVNIFGLALGLAACLIILLFVRYEISYDEWLPEHERAFQFQTWFHATDGGAEEMKSQMTSLKARAALVEDFPEIESSAYVIKAGAVVIQDEQPTLPENLFFTDGNLFEILRFPFVRGDPATALDAPNAMVLSEAESLARFGTLDSMGRVLTLVTRGERKPYVVRGVMADAPGNSHLRPAIVARIEPRKLFKEDPHLFTTWIGQMGYAYVRLRADADPDALNRRLPAWETRKVTVEPSAIERTNPAEAQDWRLVNIADVHLGEAQHGAISPGTDLKTMATFAIIALLILAMAVANFTNLATARASQRAREVALRKVLGAVRGQLVAQFISESILVTAVAMLVALAMVELALPVFNGFLGTRIAISYWGDAGLLVPSLIAVLLVGVAGGTYPAFCLSRFRPTQVLKANKSAAEPEGSGRLRSLLVVGQFAVSITLIICTAIIYAQTTFAVRSNAGYNRDGLLQVNRVAAKQVEPHVAALKSEIAKLPGVRSVAQSSIAIDPSNYSAAPVMRPGDGKPVELGYYGIDPAYIETMGMTLIAGRNFSEQIRKDDATTPFPVVAEAEREFVRRGANVIMSEQAIYRLGFESPQQAIGKQIMTPMTYPEFGVVPTTIVGVVKDVRYRSVRDPIQPIMYFWARNFHNALMVRYEGAPADQVVDGIRKIWEGIVPGVPFDADFADDRVRDLYRAEAAQGKIFASFAILAVVIGCLGLFGLAAFTAERRTKEIGIRKVLGARTRDIVRLLAWQFSKPVIIANLIAWPVAWWLMQDWLDGFDARIVLGPMPFLLAGLLALVIAIVTIAGHAIKVARSNPINALRYE